MTLFSGRRGLKPVKSLVQVESMDQDLRVGLWNMVTVHYWEKMRAGRVEYDPAMYSFCLRLWHRYLKLPLDDMPSLWQADPTSVLCEMPGMPETNAQTLFEQSPMSDSEVALFV